MENEREGYRGNEFNGYVRRFKERSGFEDGHGGYVVYGKWV